MNGKSPKITISPRPRHLLRSLLMLDDTEHAIALGTSIGVFLGLTPTVGAQMLTVMILSALTRRFFRFNVMAALMAVYISNPITIVPIYWALYKTGSFFVGGEVSRAQFAAILEYNNFAEWWNTIVELVIGLGQPLLIGTAIIAIPGGILTYPLMRWLLQWFRSEAEPQVVEDSTRTEQTESMVA
ncbi:MAG: DUF2062 domain-containing protein [Planctomycetaceae bacterium]|nr:DUF2062 domain-containing protein [Planctomycetaceae bacterium]